VHTDGRVGHKADEDHCFTAVCGQARHDRVRNIDQNVRSLSCLGEADDQVRQTVALLTVIGQ
jgi:hypothetical protein